MKNKYMLNEAKEVILTPFILFSDWAKTINESLIGLDNIHEKYNKWLIDNGYQQEKKKEIRLYLEYAGYHQVEAYNLLAQESIKD